MMAKKSKHDGLDALLAKELGLELQTQTLPLKKVQTMVCLLYTSDAADD